MLTIETGAIVVDADSYITISDVATYATRYGLAWTGTDLAKEQAILRAMVYFESFERAFRGYRVSSIQELSFPRGGLLTSNGEGYLPTNTIPKGVKNAVSEAAVIELASPGTLLTPSVASAQTVKREFRKVDVLEREIEYFEGSSAEKTDRFERFNVLIAPFLCPPANRLVRS